MTSTEESSLRDAVRHIAAVPQGHRRRAAQGAGRGANVGTFRHTAAWHRAVLLPDHDVYITDWKNARDIPLSDGVFGFDEYVDHLIRFMEVMGEGSHMIAVCQPAVAALAATAVMAEAGNRAQPRSLTLMAGPIDTRQNPTKVNELAKSRAIEWFEKKLIAKRALALQGRRSARVSGIPAIDGVHEHEPGSPHQRPYQPVSRTGVRRRCRGRSAHEVLR